MGHLLLCLTRLLCFRDEYIWMASWDFLQRFFQRKGLLQILLLTCIFLWDVLFLFHSQLLFALVQLGWVAGMRPGQGDKPKVMTSLWPWRAAVPLKCHVMASYRFMQTCFPSICCFSSCILVLFALPIPARSCTLPPVHKQIKVLAGDIASNLLWGKTQMPLRMPSAASQVHGAPQEWEQLSDWAL